MTQGFYIANAKSKISQILDKILKKYAIWYYQLKFEHGAIGAFLAKIGVIETPKCK